MIVILIILGAFGIGLFCWMVFALAVQALPFFAGVTAGLAAFNSGAGVIGATAIGMAAGIATLIAGQVVFAATRSPLIRAAIALLFAGPAAVADRLRHLDFVLIALAALFVSPIYRITNSGWSVVHRSHMWAVDRCRNSFPVGLRWFFGGFLVQILSSR